RTFFMRFHMMSDALLIARSVAVNDALEFRPIYFAEVIMTARFIPFELRIGNFETYHISLLRAFIYEALAKLIVRITFYFPADGFAGMRGIGIMRTEHHK